MRTTFNGCSNGLKASVWVYECIACDVGISSKTGFVEDDSATFLKPLVSSE